MSDEAVEQGDEADEAGASDEASQLIPSVGRTLSRSMRVHDLTGAQRRPYAFEVGSGGQYGEVA